MTQEEKQEIALMRYSAIAPLVAGLDDSFQSQSAFFEAVSAKGIPGPDGRLRTSPPLPLSGGIPSIISLALIPSSPKGGPTPA